MPVLLPTMVHHQRLAFEPCMGVHTTEKMQCYWQPVREANILRHQEETMVLLIYIEGLLPTTYIMIVLNASSFHLLQRQDLLEAFLHRLIYRPLPTTHSQMC